jgi:hypothetical protein
VLDSPSCCTTPVALTAAITFYQLILFTMKLSILALLCGSAAAFAPVTTQSGSTVVAKAAIDDLEAIAAKSNPVLKVSEWGFPPFIIFHLVLFALPFIVE